MSPEEQPGRESWRPERETRAQRAWQPGQQKTQRSIFVLFASTVLLGEAFVIAFFGLMLYGLNQDNGGLWMLLGSLVLAIITGVTARFVKKPAGIAVGWIIQGLLVASGFFESFGFFIGIAFALAWWYAITKGKQIDAENAQRAKEQEAWEQEHGTEADTD
ncbi:DUF4233 domain-containing protein [Enteractinococcus coprophilus]|uniref:Uncharacterized protein DUF4233 n=1 Tax=Enteractinococcus coprophilus TaxID=1027633 RepID=A0A543AIV9_9MICC|nr:DUF4233 domain-containing protein [Enteractinococcus coprophilus]TQL72519.1 uncharacterized protein DUF4233 [Enteractinococcus coprophilus]